MTTNFPQRPRGFDGVAAGMPASLCVILRDDGLRRDVVEALRRLGFSVHPFHCGAAFLLSGAARTCEGLVAEFRLTGITLPELRTALAGEGLHVPIVLVVHPDDSEAQHLMHDPLVEAVAADAPPDAFAHAVRAVLARRTR